MIDKKVWLLIYLIISTGLFTNSVNGQIISPGYQASMVKDVNPGTGYGCITSFQKPTPYKNGVFFIGNDGINGIEPWFSDGTSAGTIMLSNIAPGSANSAPQFIAVINNILIFSATNSVLGTELWKTDGTPAGTSLLYEIAPGAVFDQGFNNKLDTLNNLLLFWGTTSATGKELYRTDGTTAGTQFLGDALPGANGAGNNFTPNVTITRTGGKLFFTSNGFNTFNDEELMVTDGTPSGTRILEINSTGPSYPFIFAAINGDVYFEAETDANGFEIWKSDGTAAGTALYHEFTAGALPYQHQIMEIQPEMSMGNARGFFRINGVYRELFRLDAGTPGVTLLKSFRNYTGDHQSIKFNNMIYFNAFDTAQVYGVELWKTDLTASGTVMVKDINPGSGSSMPNFYGIVNNTILMDAYHASYGRELWRSNGTALTTSLIKNIVPNLTNVLMTGYKIKFGTNKFIFTVDHNTMDPWITDGTTNGTFNLKNSSSLFLAKNYYQAHGKIYFTGYQSIDDQEVYKTDGTIAGTVLVKDVNPPTPGLDPITNGFVASGNYLFYNFLTSNSGNELWRLQLQNRQTSVVHLKYNESVLEDVSEELTTYPNPSSSVFYIQSDENIQEKLQLEVKDINGKTMYVRIEEPSASQEPLIIDLTGFADGVYVLHLTASNYRRSCKLVKK